MSQQSSGVTPHLRILRRDEVQNRTGFSRSTIYRRVSEHTFPQPINLGGRAVGWVEAEIHQWIEQQIASSRAKPAAMSAGPALQVEKRPVGRSLATNRTDPSDAQESDDSTQNGSLSRSGGVTS